MLPLELLCLFVALPRIFSQTENALAETYLWTANNATSESTASPPVARPTIYGLRAEVRDDDDISFGYEASGVCIISPDVPIKMVVYGSRLEQFIFTSSDNCSDPTRIINADKDFTVLLEHRAVFELAFPTLPENMHAYKMCVRHKIPMNDNALLPVAYDRKRLMELIKLNTVNEDGQLAEEFKIAVGAMELYDKVGKDVMTKVEDVFMLPNNTVLNAKTVAEIVRTGYTRIPVYMPGDKNCITDILFVKDLALLDPDDNFTVKTVCGYHQHPVKFVLEDTPLKVMLEEFKKGDCHMAIVERPNADSFDVVGIVTLEDIVEEILQAEIMDEFDIVTDNIKRTRRKTVHRDLAKFFEKDVPDASVSMQIQIVAAQWLTANEPAFSEQYIDRNVLERLVRTNCKKIDISALKAITGKDFPVLPKNAKLFTNGETSNRFVLILEGRAMVTIGQDEMKFEAGPWHSFGDVVLRKMTGNCGNLCRSMSVADGTDFSTRRPDLSFVPDYSVVVNDNCTFLDISASSYVNAYRATLMQRETGKGDVDLSTTSLNGAKDDPHAWKQVPVNKFISQPKSPITRTLEEVTTIPRLATNLSEARAAVKALNMIERDRKEHLEDIKDEEQMNLLKAKITDEDGDDNEENE
uniref:Cyclic nucleotide-binding domain-containing protein n=1 Tax=Steinernema glaseri TaxID=37863 RepID=A0A1I8ASV1_9BILA